MTPQMKKLFRDFERLQVHRGVLFRCIYDPKDGEKFGQLVVPDPLKHPVHVSQHEDGSHFGE